MLIKKLYSWSTYLNCYLNTTNYAFLRSMKLTALQLNEKFPWKNKTINIRIHNEQDKLFTISFKQYESVWFYDISITN